MLTRSRQRGRGEKGKGERGKGMAKAALRQTITVQLPIMAVAQPASLSFASCPLPFPLFPLLTYSASLTNRAGFSCEVSAFISGVAVTRPVRRMNMVETIRVIVQANPPSMP